MFKKVAFTVPVAILALSSSVAFAADEIRSSINISADVPSSVFHAQPVTPGFGTDEKMAYNVVDGSLSSLREMYDVRHTDGSIGAYVEGGPQPLFNGSDSIALTYTFNGVVLTASSQQVVTEAVANPGTRAELVIAAAKPAPGKFGKYTATPVVVFDAIPKVGP
ncbi:fimbrial protein [Pseudomonas sp. PDM32]|uniref:CS1 type fimbrial major subunit n=1 Tax=Pseudomonas sp. PDM32 TaxID=2854768 RepID=UPI001C456FE7|nr:CS1 type fimbrial major subunit [Pseudomonas sp. PDM32]MBV7576069.1 fimbrial protein [Pseudomonas sp. PDM32]